MKYVIELISEIKSEITLEEKHSKVNSRLRAIPEPWGIGNQELKSPDFRNELSIVVNISRFLKRGIKGEIIYGYRGKTVSKMDDRIYIKFNPNKIDISELIKSVFKQYVCAFDPSEAQIFNEEVIHFDYENRKNYDMASYIRFCQVFFWSESFCQNRIGLSVTEMRNKLFGYVENVELFENGIFVVVSSKILSIDESNNINDHLRKLLT